MHCIVGFALLFLLGHAAGLCRDLRHRRRCMPEHGADPQWNVRALAVVLLCAALVRRALSPEPHVPQPTGLCRERE